MASSALSVVKSVVANASMAKATATRKLRSRRPALNRRRLPAEYVVVFAMTLNYC